MTRKGKESKSILCPQKEATRVGTGVRGGYGTKRGLTSQSLTPRAAAQWLCGLREVT